MSSISLRGDGIIETSTKTSTVQVMAWGEGRLKCYNLSVCMPLVACKTRQHGAHDYAHDTVCVDISFGAHLEACGIHDPAFVSAPAAALLLTTWFRMVIGFW